MLCNIGADGASQMGLEDIAIFRTLLDCIVFYPSDGVSTEALVRLAAGYRGNVYIRTTRMDTPIIYDSINDFKIGKSRIVKSSNKDRLAVIAAGVTLHEAMKAYEELARELISILEKQKNI